MARRHQRNSRNSQQKVSSQTDKTSAGKEVSKTSPDTTAESTQAEPSSTNDVAWYAQIPELLRDSANVPYAYPYGGSLSLGLKENMITKNNWVTEGVTLNNVGAPGICTVYTRPAIGSNRGNINDPINVAANSLYAYLRINATGRKNYDPSDALMYCLAFAELYSFVFWCQRIYSLGFMYSQHNYYIEEELLKANGLVPSAVKLDLAQFRYWLNSYINKISSYAIPNNIYYFNRRAFMYANYYIENPEGNIKDALYQFVPDGFWRLEYNEGALDGTAGMPNLNVIHWNRDANNTLRQLMNYGNDLLKYISGNEDLGIISSDIIRAFGSNLISIAPIPEDSILLPVYDKYVLSQFKNATVWNVANNLTGAEGNKYPFWHQYTIDPDDEDIIHYGYYGNVYVNQDGLLVSKQRVADFLYPDDQAFLATIELFSESDKVLSVETFNPDVGDTIEATRLVNSTLYNQDDPFILSCGSDIAVKVSFVYKGNDRPINLDPEAYNQQMRTRERGFSVTVLNASSVSNNDYFAVDVPVGYEISLLWKYAPQFYVSVVNVDDRKVMALNIHSNIENVTLVPPASLTRMHECALLSMFYVPGIAKLV